jgi:hypothetical protein
MGIGVGAMVDKKNKAAIMLGKLGGTARSRAKVDASRVNGAKGGRPLRVELAEEHRAVLVEVLNKDLAKLTRFRDDDPEWSDRLWQKSIDECNDLCRKFHAASHLPLRVNLKKTDLIHVIQLLADRIALEERVAKKSHVNRVLDDMLTRYQAVAQHLDSFVSSAPAQPSVFAHYLKEARGRFS